MLPDWLIVFFIPVIFLHDLLFLLYNITVFPYVFEGIYYLILNY